MYHNRVDYVTGSFRIMKLPKQSKKESQTSKHSNGDVPSFGAPCLASTRSMVFLHS